MRSITTLFILLFFFSLNNLNAQSDWKYGVLGGFTISDVNGDTADALNTSSSESFHAGFTVEFPINKKWSFQTYLLYSEQGFEFDTGMGAGEVELTYINVPFMANYYLIEGLHVSAGPQIGFAVDKELTMADGTKGDIRNVVNSDFGLNAGLGYKTKFGLFFNAMATFGITDIFNTRTDLRFEPGDVAFLPNQTDIDIQNMTFTFSIGYMFKR